MSCSPISRLQTDPFDEVDTDVEPTADRGRRLHPGLERFARRLSVGERQDATQRAARRLRAIGVAQVGRLPQRAFDVSLRLIDQTDHGQADGLEPSTMDLPEGFVVLGCANHLEVVRHGTVEIADVSVGVGKGHACRTIRTTVGRRDLHRLETELHRSAALTGVPGSQRGTTEDLGRPRIRDLGPRR